MPSNFSLKFAILFSVAICQLTATAQNAPAAPTAASSAAVVAPSENALSLVKRIVALQSGPEMERTVFQLTSGAMQPLIAKWAPKMEGLPASKQDKAREQLNAELKTTGDATRKIIETQMSKSANSVLEKAYLDRFTEDELKAIVAMFESPVFKKYQSVAPELGNVWVKDVIDNSRDAVLAQGKSFDDAAAKIVGESPAAPVAPTKHTPAKSSKK